MGEASYGASHGEAWEHNTYKKSSRRKNDQWHSKKERSGFRSIFQIKEVKRISQAAPALFHPPSLSDPAFPCPWLWVTWDPSCHPSLILLASDLPLCSLSSLAVSAPARCLPSTPLSLQVLENSLHFCQRIQPLRLENPASVPECIISTTT